MTRNQRLRIPQTKQTLQLRRQLRRPRERRSKGTRRPVLRFSPTAWAKLLSLRDQGSTEVGGFAITSSDDLLYVEDVCLIQQNCTAVSVKFDDVAVAEFFEDQVAAGLRPEQFARVWIHTHPGDSASPSHVDERTFRRVFGRCDWAVMFILAQGGQTYARIRYGVGPGGAMEIPVRVDFRKPFTASDIDCWQCEYAASVHPLEFMPTPVRAGIQSNTGMPASPDSSSDEFFFDEYTLERRELESIESV